FLAALAVTGAPPMKGVALGLYSEDPGFSYAPLLGEIAKLGATHVEFVINLYQRDGASTELHAHTRFTPSDAAILPAPRDARAGGAGCVGAGRCGGGGGRGVVFRPAVRLESPRGGEGGAILNPADAAAWWKSYGKLLGHYAGLAQRAQAAALVIGSELSTLDGDPRPWQTLARDVRRKYHGQLVYAANWDHYRDVRVWPAVDVLGL